MGSGSTRSVRIDSPSQSIQAIVDEPTLGFTLYGMDPLVVQTASSGGQVSAWAIDGTDGTTTLLGRGMSNIQVATKPGAVGVVYTATDASGTHRYYRKFSAAGLEQGTFTATASGTLNQFMIAHDGSLIGISATELVALPSGATSTITLPANFSLRCDRTASATICSHGVSSMSVLAYYDGDLHDTGAVGTVRELSDAQNLATSFVKYHAPDGWRIAHVSVLGDGTVELTDVYSETIAANEPRIQGRDPVGRYVVEAEQWLLADDTTGIQVIAPATASPVYQDTSSPVVAFAGEDAMGAYLLSTAHPERCWQVPTAHGLLGTTTQPSYAHLIHVDEIEDLTLVSWSGEASPLRFWILRPRNHPDRPPPTP